MVLGFLITLLCIDAALLILVILVQKGKGSMGLGNLGGSTQMIFGVLVDRISYKKLRGY